MHFKRIDFLFGEDIGLLAGGEGLIGNARCHLQEHGTLEHIVERCAAHHLSVLQQLYGVAVAEGSDDGLGKFGTAGSLEGNFGDYASYVQGHFSRHGNALGAFLAAGEQCGIGTLEVEHHIDVGTFEHDTAVEHAFHRGFHPVEHFTVGNAHARHLFGGEGRNPASGAGNEHLVAKTPAEVSAGTDGKSGITHTVGLADEFLIMISFDHDFRILL